MNLLRGDIEASLRDFTQRVESWQSTNFCGSKNDKKQSAQSANPCKSFCYFWLSPKVESPLHLNFNLPSEAVSQNLAKNNSRVSTKFRKIHFVWITTIQLTPNLAIMNPFHNPTQRLNRAF